MTITLIDELKDCPFCGGEASISLGLMNGDQFPYVECLQCAASTDLEFTEKDAIEKWNRRVRCLEC